MIQGTESSHTTDALGVADFLRRAAEDVEAGRCVGVYAVFFRPDGGVDRESMLLSGGPDLKQMVTSVLEGLVAFIRIIFPERHQA